MKVAEKLSEKILSIYKNRNFMIQFFEKGG